MQIINSFEPNKVGAFVGVPAEIYHQAPGISNSSLKAIARSPLDFKRFRDGAIEREETEYMQYGQLFHSACLENRTLSDLCYVHPELYADGTKPWHNGARECKVWNELHADRPILSNFDYHGLLNEVNYVRSHPKVMGLITAGWIEVSCFAMDPSGVLIKGRLDNIRMIPGGGWAITDLKTTQDASSDGFRREILKRKYHVQAAMYRRIVRLLDPGVPVLYAFIAVEKGKAIKVNVKYLTNGAMDLGDQEIDKNLACYAECMRTGQWPEWGDESKEIDFIDLPESCYSDDILEGLTPTTIE